MISITFIRRITIPYVCHCMLLHVLLYVMYVSTFSVFFLFLQVYFPNKADQQIFVHESMLLIFLIN